jgi:hypothetical protein
LNEEFDMSNHKLLTGVCLIASILLCSNLQMMKAGASEFSAREEAMAFLSDVVSLDLTKFDTKLLSYQVSYPEEYGGLMQERIRFNLVNNESKLDVTCVFVNGTYSYCILTWLGEQTDRELPPSELLDMVQGVLERYQFFSQRGSSLDELQNILDSANELSNATVVQDDLKLKISLGERVDFEWSKIYSGVETPRLEIAMQDGKLWSLNDRWNLFNVHNDNVNINKEDAIAIALRTVQNFSWMVNGAPITQFAVSNESPTANLALNFREPLNLYPVWTVNVWLNKTYEGGVNRIAVALWADTGDIIFAKELGNGGAGSVTTNLPSTGSSHDLVPTYLLLPLIAAIAVVFALIILKKPKRKRK